MLTNSTKVLSDTAPIDMLQKTVADWREVQNSTKLQSLLVVEAIAPTTVDSNAWARTMLRDLTRTPILL